MPRHAPFGDTDVPFAEPAWYRGTPTPYYTADHARWRVRVREWCEREVAPFGAEWEEQGDFPIERLRASAAAAGVLAPWAPRELGGTPPPGWDDFAFLIWVDEITRSVPGGVAIVLFFINVMSVPHTLRYGSEQLRELACRPVIRGDTTMSVCLTEPTGGSDLANLKTTARLSADGSEYVVSGNKKFITGGTKVGWFSTLVRTGGKGLGGVSLLLIPAGAPGISIRRLKAQGWWSGNTCSVAFENVRVPAANIIGKPGRGFQIMADVMNGERLIACVGAVRSARMCLVEGARFARTRVTFGHKLSEHQVIRHKIAQMALRVEAAQASVESLCFSMREGAKPAEIGGPTALAKVQCTQALEYCAREASQILGGASFLREGKGQTLERIVREVRVAVVGGGSEEVMLDLAMRQARL